MAMNANFRHMILEENATTPVGQLSSAFLNAKDQEHILFAYFQSSQVVAYLLKTFGVARFQGILRDLAAGKRINEALESNTVALGSLEKDFDHYLRDQAEAYGEKADWAEPKPEDLNPLDEPSLVTYLKKHPRNLWAIHRQIDRFMELSDWDSVLPLADQLIEWVPEDVSTDSGYQLKATALRKLRRTEEEAAVLRLMVERDPSAKAVLLRLIELDLAGKDWESVQTQAQRTIALNPFLLAPQQALAEAAEALGQSTEAIAAYRRVLLLDPVSAAMIHYKLAKLLRQSDEVQAKKHLLEALALAPRFRLGHQLLQEWP
jgi:tetratricopeptide (TPR) repeat protein